MPLIDYNKGGIGYAVLKKRMLEGVRVTYVEFLSNEKYHLKLKRRLNSHCIDSGP